MRRAPSAEGSASLIWDQRYEDGDGACASEPDGTDLTDNTQHDFLNRNLVCKQITGDPTRETEGMIEMDPSEGVHSSMILTLIFPKFDVTQRFGFGGNLMRPFWVGILPNFDFADHGRQKTARIESLFNGNPAREDRAFRHIHSKSHACHSRPAT